MTIHAIPRVNPNRCHPVRAQEVGSTACGATATRARQAGALLLVALCEAVLHARHIKVRMCLAPQRSSALYGRSTWSTWHTCIMILFLSEGPSPAPARLPRRAVTLLLLSVVSICLTVRSSSVTISRYLNNPAIALCYVALRGVGGRVGWRMSGWQEWMGGGVQGLHVSTY